MESDEYTDETESDISGSGEDSETDTTKVNKSSIKRKKGVASEHGLSSKKKKRSELYKPPTVEELNSLKETENLFNNNLFRLQIQELLSEVNIKNKRRTNLLSWISSFEQFLDMMPGYDVLLSDLKSTKKKGALGKLLAKLSDYEEIYETDQDVLLKLVKPESFECFGLYEYNSLPGPYLSIDINLIMPTCCFVTKDFLNNRYLTKRYYYLLYIAEHLKKSELTATLNIKFCEENLLPLIELTTNTCEKTIITIYVSPADGTFRPVRFLPEQNNVKLDLFKLNIPNEVLRNSPTIYYNSVIAHDATLHVNIQFIKDTLKDQSNLHDGIKLLCIWLKQYELNKGKGSFTENLIVYIIVYLFSKRKINRFMSSYQVIRNFWNFIASTDLQNEPISIANTTSEVLNSFKKFFNVVILDCTGCYNVACFLNFEVYKKIKVECQSALKLLDDNKTNSFQQLFLTKYPFYLQYDLVIDLTKSLPLESKISKSHQEKALYVGHEELLTTDHMLKFIQKAMKERVLLTVPRIDLHHRSIKHFLIGVNLNPDKAFNFLELGPALSDHKSADDFRKFWGHLSSDRRFRDGSTNVAVHFKTNTMKGKRNIIKKILHYIFNEKLDVKFSLYYDELEDVLLSKNLIPSYPSGTNEETCLKIIWACDELGKKLRSLQMSLKITEVQGIGDIFSFTEAFPPIPANYKAEHSSAVKGNSIVFSNENVDLVPRFIQPVECVIELEHSSKWPNDLDALRAIKASFYLEMSKILNKEHVIISQPTADFIDVLYEGLVFRYRLYVPREIGLLKKVAAENGLICFRESEESFEIEKILRIMPRIVGALKGIQSIHPSYGPGTVLVKRWLRAHLIDSYHIPDIVINLLNASLYLNGTSPPNTPQISFFRCLKFLSELDWNLNSVIVNFNEELTNEEISELESKLQCNRESKPLLYIITPYDGGASVFTKSSPSREILLRIKQLSGESLAIMNKVTIDREAIDVKKLFVPNFEGYNVLIHLRPLLNPRRHEQLFENLERTVVEKYKASKDDKLPIVNFNPVDIYLRTLRENYGQFAIFFHDSYGGNIVGVLWRPKVFEIEDFKVSRVNAGKIIEGKIKFNMDAVIEDFYILGKSLVKTIEIR
nr:nucleolar protein 6 [Leptinotarsa decemlineata]